MAFMTYTAFSRGFRGIARDVREPYRIRASHLPEQVRRTLQQLRDVEERVARLGAGPLHDRDVLIIGAGQTPREVMAFSASNRVTGIDLDVIPHGFDPRAYLRLARQNGLPRALKTRRHDLS